MTRRDRLNRAVAEAMSPPSGMRDWSSRQRLKAGEALRYSRFVSVMKRILPLAAVVLMASVVAYSVLPRNNERTVALQQSGNLASDLTMTKSSFTGTDEKGNPFKITAAEVIQDPKAKNTLRAELKLVEADMQFGKDAWISASAAHGWIDAEAGMLKLDGGISIYTDTGFELQTQSAVAHIKANTLEGTEGVKGHGPAGKFSADRFFVDRKKQQLHLSGHVKTTLFPQKANKR